MQLYLTIAVNYSRRKAPSLIFYYVPKYSSEKAHKHNFPEILKYFSCTRYTKFEHQLSLIVSLYKIQFSKQITVQLSNLLIFLIIHVLVIFHSYKSHSSFLTSLKNLMKNLYWKRNQAHFFFASFWITCKNCKNGLFGKYHNLFCASQSCAKEIWILNNRL